MKVLIFSVIALSLTGCILNRYEKPPTLQKIPCEGTLTLLDISTLSSEGKVSDEAGVEAQFIKTEETSSNRRYSQNKLMIEPMRGRGLQCQLSSRDSKEKTTPVGVGNLSLGTLVSEQVIEIPEVKTGVYQKSLLPHFAPGIYFVRGSGAGIVPAFGVEFSMPEEIRHVSVNAHGLEEGPAIFQKTENAILQLDPPTAPNDMNILQMILITKKEMDERVLICAAYENELTPSNGKQTIEIPAVQMSGLHATPDGVLEIMRLNLIGGVVPKGPRLRLEGVRAWVWPSWVAE